MDGKYYCEDHKHNFYPEIKCQYCFRLKPRQADNNKSQDEDKPVFVSIRRELLDEVIDRLNIGLGAYRSLLIEAEQSRYYGLEVMKLEASDIEATIEKLEKHV